MAMINIEQGIKIYRSGSTEVEALRGVTLKIDKGEFLSIAGPSGSGKTTLLNIIGCIDSLTQGKILMENEELSAFSHKALTELRRQKIGFVFQSYNLIPVMTAFENIALTLSLLKVPQKELTERVERILEEVGLKGIWLTATCGAFGRPTTTSGGSEGIDKATSYRACR